MCPTEFLSIFYIHNPFLVSFPHAQQLHEVFCHFSLSSHAQQRYEVTFSMLEIYNEQVRDLLSKDNPKGGLQVRQNPTLGMFYVENLKKVPVGSYAEIEKRMEQGKVQISFKRSQVQAAIADV